MVRSIANGSVTIKLMDGFMRGIRISDLTHWSQLDIQKME